MKSKLSATILLCLSLSSCGGLIGGPTQNVFLRASDGSQDIDVEVSTANGVQNATIPSNIMVARNKMPLAIKVKENKCYQESTTYSVPKYNMWVIANALGGVTFGVTSTVVDMSNGTAWAYDDNIFVDVKKNRSCK